MASQRSAPEVGGSQAARLTFASLPRALQCEVFARTPVDARARAAAVCKAWCGVLSERSLWTRLDLSPASGVARVTDALLRGAAGKAQGGLTALDVSECVHLTHEAIQEAVTANAGALTELRACRGFTLAVTAEQAEALLGAAPLLRVCHADARAAAADACRMLRKEPPFGPLRLQQLFVYEPWPGGEADVRAFAADLTASASSVSQLLLIRAPLAGLGALDAVADAVLARRLSAFGLIRCSPSAVSAPALARLLGGSALENFSISNTGDEPLLLSGAEGSAALVTAALRANNTLALLGLACCNVWFDAAAAETLLQALTGHPSVRSLRLFDNPVRTADRARAGAALGALVAANAPAPMKLDVSQCALSDEGLGPLVDALAANTHLQELTCSGNGVSDAFALERLRPALLANTSLQRLKLAEDDEDDEEDEDEEEEEEEKEDEEDDVDVPVLRQLEALVAERAAAA
jgi:hypothetical protein